MRKSGPVAAMGLEALSPVRKQDGTMAHCVDYQREACGGVDMKGVALWALGIPIPVIILLYVFHIL